MGRMSKGEFSRLIHFNYLNDDMLRGSVYFAKRNRIDADFLTKRASYRVMGILRKEFLTSPNGVIERQNRGDDPQSEFNRFVEWINQPFSKEDNLHGTVKYMQKNYGTVQLCRYTMPLRNAGELYLATAFDDRSQGDHKKLKDISSNELQNILNE